MRRSKDEQSRRGWNAPAPRWVVAAVSGGGGVILVAALVQNAGNLAFHVLASHVVGPSRYGALGALLTLTVALSMPLIALQVVLTRSVAEAGTDADARRPLRRVASFAIGLGAIVVLLSPLVQGFLRLDSVVQAALLGPYFTLAAIAAAGRGVAIGRGRVGGAAVSIIGATVARLALGVLGAMWAGLDGALVATVAGEAVGATLALRAATKRTVDGTNLTLDLAGLFEAATVTAGIWLLGSVDVLLARHYLAGPASAIYVAAGTGTRAVFLLPQTFLTVAIVRFVRGHSMTHGDGGVEAWRALRETLVVTAVLATTGAVAVATVGPTLLTLAFGSRYSGSGTLFVWLAAATVPAILASVLSTYYLARRSRLALVPWIGVCAEIAAISLFHGSPAEVAAAAFAGVGLQGVIVVALIARERASSGPAHEKSERVGAAMSHPDRSLRVLVFNWRDRAHPAAGGAEVYIEEIATRWVAAGHLVTLFCAAVPGRPEREIVDGIEIVRRGSRISVYRQARRFWRSEARDRFDLVIDCVNTRPFGTPGFITEVPVLALVHQVAREVWWYEAPLPIAVVGRFVLERHWLRRYRHTPVLTVSESSRQSLAAYGLRRISIVPEGIDIPPLAAVPAKPPEPLLVFCGRLVRSKRPLHAIAAFEVVRKRFPTARLVVIGAGPMEKRLRKHAPEGVDFVGHVSQDHKHELMGRAHAIVVTSVREGWGLVVSEAAALGTAAVAYDVAGLRDSVAASGGWLSHPAPDALGDMIAKMLPTLIAEPPQPRPWGGAASWDHVADVVLAHARVAVGLSRIAPTDTFDTARRRPEPTPARPQSVAVPSMDAVESVI